ncbi:MAG TPA: LytTR family DNA-binding domain-containing protein [Firmicutes bacterium]|nr:LytTR family DNA-binding domain-containing protein [Bacillota bacterium]
MRLAIVEDDKSAADELRALLRGYEKEHGGSYAVDVFADAVTFLTAYRPDYDVVFLDIEMPMMDGLTAAEKLREIDPYVILVFVTNMRQYAINGYAVNALDFIVKPVSKFDFDRLMNKVRRALAAGEDKDVTITSAGMIRRIPSSRIKYVEIYRHKLTFHTEDGDIESWGSLADVETQVPADSFAKCNNCFLVNLKYVDGVEKEEVIIGGDRLRISHLRRKDFVAALTRWLGRRK